MMRLVLLFTVVLAAAAGPAEMTLDSFMCAGVTSSRLLEGEQQAIEVALQALEQTQVNITCTECNAMLSALQGFCKENHVSTPLLEQYNTACRRHTIPVTPDYTTLPQKCDAFHAFISALYCPLDPCVQVSLAMKKAPTAICDLMRCRHTAAEKDYIRSRVVVPLTCPAYLETIVGYCQRKPPTTPLTADVCVPYPSRFAREGCELTLERVISVSSPLDFCTAGFCDGIPPTEYGRYCREVLHIPPFDPVPVPAYLAWLNGTTPTNEECMAPPDIVLNITSATFGTNCSQLRDNIHDSVRTRCNGKRECFFGNADLKYNSSAWRPEVDLGLNITCNREFEIKYKCSTNGPEYHITNDGTAAFQAFPFDCLNELKFKTFRPQPDDKMQDKIMPVPRRVTVGY